MYIASLNMDIQLVCRVCW